MSDNQLIGLAEDFFQNSLDSSPTSAIMRGHKKYFDQIEELTEEQFEKETEVVDTFIQRLNKIEKDNLTSKFKKEEGGLSGEPLNQISTNMIKKFYKEFGVEVEVAWGNKETMGDKRASEEWAKDPVTGKENKKKIKLTYNVDAITLGLAPHELGHAGMKILFGERAGFKSDFLLRMGNISKELTM